MQVVDLIRITWVATRLHAPSGITPPPLRGVVAHTSHAASPGSAQRQRAEGPTNYRAFPNWRREWA